MKKLLPVLFVSLFLLAFTASAFSIANLFEGFFSPPSITDASLSLEKVIPGDELIITISAEDTFGINEVRAEIEHERGTDKVEFLLVSGNNKKGIWKGIWKVHDTIEKKLYKAKVTVVNRHNSEAKIELTFEDPVVSHSPSQITPQGTGSGLNADLVDAYHAADLLAQGGQGGGVAITSYYKHIYFYLTSQEHNGNLGGLTGADAICSTEKPKLVPNGLTYKAYLCDSKKCQKPTASPNTIVVMARPDSEVKLDRYYIINPLKSPDYISAFYGSNDYIKIGLSGLARTDSSLYTLDTLGLTAATIKYWTGAESTPIYTNAYALNVYDFAPSVSYNYNCVGWTSTTVTVVGSIGQNTEAMTTTGWINPQAQSCSLRYPIICYAYD